jgi:NADH dehydrogenase
MENNKICTILGAGFVGRYVVKYLDRKGYRSIVISRNPFRKNYILTQARTGYVDIVKFNYTEIKKAIQKSDYVLNLIGILGPTKDFFKIHSELPDYISKLCGESKNVQKLIHVSSIGASKNSKSIYQQSKFSGEEKILNNFSSSVIIRPSLVLGAESKFERVWGKLSIFPILPVFNYRWTFPCLSEKYWDLYFNLCRVGRFLLKISV